MRESIKVTCVLVLIVCSVVAAAAWTDTKPNSTTWACRLGGAAAALLALGIFLKMHFRADLVHDYLRDVSSTYFNRDGFCFVIRTEAVGGIGYIVAYFQNQRNRQSIGKIALRPARGFFMNRAPIQAITYLVPCEPAAFGVARIALPLPKELQGKRQSFEVGASVVYPKGRGRLVRFRDGICLRTNANFGNSFGTALIVAGAATGHLVLHRPATATFELPMGVAEELPGDPVKEMRTLWRLGSPPLKSVTSSDQPA